MVEFRSLQKALNQVWKEKIADLNTRFYSINLKWVYVEDVRNLQFEEGDVANDCFHPSVRGHAKIADLILRQQFGR